MKEGNYCPPAIFFKNTENEGKTQIEVIQEKTVKVEDPKIKYEQNNQKTQNVGKKIFSLN